MMCAMKWGAFLFFAAFVVAATIYVQLLVPETKGVPIEEIDLVFAAHRVWKRYVVVYNSGTGGCVGMHLCAPLLQLHI